MHDSTHSSAKTLFSKLCSVCMSLSFCGTWLVLVDAQEASARLVVASHHLVRC